MKKFSIALIAALVGLASCDTGLLNQTPGQAPKIVGIEVTGARADLYQLVGGAGVLGLTTAWDPASTVTAEYKMQVGADGKGSIKFSTPKTLNLGDEFKLSGPGWAAQIGLENPGSGDTANISFAALKAGFTGKTYKIVLTVTSIGGATGIRCFAKGELVEVADASAVMTPNAVTGSVAAGPLPTYAKIGKIIITGGAASQLYYLTGSDGSLIKDDKSAYIVGDFVRYAASSETGSGKDFVLKTDATGAVTKTFETKKDSYDSKGTKTEVTFATPYLAKLGGQIRIDLPYKDASGNLLATGTALTFASTLVDQINRPFDFSTSPNRVYDLTYNVATKAWSFYAAPVPSSLSIIGSATGSWDNSKFKLAMDTTTSFMAITYLAVGEIKFRNEDNGDKWAESYGKTTAAAVNDDKGRPYYGVGSDNVPIATAGNYFIRIVFDAVAGNKLYVVPVTSFGIIGDGTPGGWGAQTNFTTVPNSQTSDVWSITANTTAAGLLFRLNDNWEYALGANKLAPQLAAGIAGFADGKDNLSVAASTGGTITFNGRTLTYTKP